jgi:threonine synthase
MVVAMLTISASEGISAAPESGATFAALTVLVDSGAIKPHDRVVLLSTGGALKYLDALPA